MQRIQLGPLWATLRGGEDGSGGGSGPALVLLHGYGAPGGDLVPLTNSLAALIPESSPPLRYIFPEAPLSIDVGLPPPYEGRAWWNLDMVRLQVAVMTQAYDEFAREVPAGLVSARETLDRFLDVATREFAIPDDQLILGGFSQGAMLSCDYALRSARPLAGLALLSGVLIAAPEWLPRFDRRRGLEVMMSHGREDPVLPFALAERLRDAAIQGGWHVDFVPFTGGHGIPEPALVAVAEVVRRALER